MVRILGFHYIAQVQSLIRGLIPCKLFGVPKKKKVRSCGRLQRMWSPGFKKILVCRENEKETKLTRKYKRMQYTLVNTGKPK